MDLFFKTLAAILVSDVLGRLWFLERFMHIDNSYTEWLENVV